jgi:competence protein ComEA
VLVLAALGIAIAVSAFGSHGATTTVSTPHPIGTAPMSGSAAPRTQLYIHLVGAVVRPGLYVLSSGDRVIDAVAAGGGFAPGADQGQVNLARVLSDGEQIVVPAVGEAPPAGGSEPSQAGGKVNINSADETTLETLPRVGPAMAARIIDWRKTNGRFTAIEDLMSVTGIGQKTFDGFKDLVTV